MARKNLFKKRETINIYVDHDLKIALEEVAHSEGEAVSQIVRRLIKEYISSKNKH